MTFCAICLYIILHWDLSIMKTTEFTEMLDILKLITIVMGRLGSRFNCIEQNYRLGVCLTVGVHCTEFSYTKGLLYSYAYWPSSQRFYLLVANLFPMCHSMFPTAGNLCRNCWTVPSLLFSHPSSSWHVYSACSLHREWGIFGGHCTWASEPLLDLALVKWPAYCAKMFWFVVWSTKH